MKDSILVKILLVFAIIFALSHTYEFIVEVLAAIWFQMALAPFWSVAHWIYMSAIWALVGWYASIKNRRWWVWVLVAMVIGLFALPVLWVANWRRDRKSA